MMEYKVGDKVKLKNKRGDCWNPDGKMDDYIGAIVTIADIWDSRFDIVEDNRGLEITRTFNLDDIERTITKEEKHSKADIGIKQVIFNAPATIVIWKDGTKTVVKVHDENFNKEKGFLHCYFEKHSGMTKTQIHKFFDEIKA